MNTWKEMISKKIDAIEDLENVLPLSNEEKKMIEKISERHPMCITDYYMKLIDPDDPNDPIKRLAIPNVDETNPHGTYDTSGEEDNTIMQGFQHKYHSTALVLSTNQCFVYCRFCFRKRMVGYTEDEILRRMIETVDYIKKHQEINNVLISGGDSFTLSNQMIERYLKELTSIEHLDFIRFGTRVPVVFPMRIYLDEEFLDILKKYSKLKQIVVVTHFNHPRELTMEAKKGIEALKSCGVIVRNQTVLLKGVNDHPDILSELLRKLTSFGIHPYYVFQCRPVKYATGYQVPIYQGINIIKKARNKLNGIAKGFRYALSHPRGKIEIVGILDDEMIFRFHQFKNEEDQEFMFKKPCDKKATWLDENLNFEY